MEKSLFKKSKIKIALLGVISELIVAVVGSYVAPEQQELIMTAMASIAGIFAMVLNAHGKVDAAATAGKINGEIAEAMHHLNAKRKKR